MKTLSKSPISIASTFLWIGFVSAISFLEAPLKFQAPGITIPLGLGIGRLVFGTLNKIEWVFVLAILSRFLIKKERVFLFDYVYLLIPVSILVIQTVWLLPALDARAELVLHGKMIGNSYHHFFYAAAEIFKVGSLVIYGFKEIGAP